MHTFMSCLTSTRLTPASWGWLEALILAGTTLLLVSYPLMGQRTSSCMFLSWQWHSAREQAETCRCRLWIGTLLFPSHSVWPKQVTRLSTDIKVGKWTAFLVRGMTSSCDTGEVKHWGLSQSAMLWQNMGYIDCLAPIPVPCITSFPRLTSNQ